ncbi:MAG: phage baseplate protein [Anaerorhabdus sp.]|uniref:phage distal tail protein domain-containing protein n=1 Tax=Anaerorhabdus sp. TaxID=1872524 RepID=UPI002FC98622
MTRGFQIFNSAGDSIDLLNNLDFFSINPEGLGVSFNNDYHETNSNYLLDSSKMNMGQFNIDILFGAITGDPYIKYDELIRLLNKPPYVLVYETDAGIWSRGCKLNELTKTEIKELNILVETITLDLMTPWYVDIEESYVPTPQQDGDGKIYREANDEQNEVIYNTTPTTGYEAGDRWNWDKSQTWLGCNLISRKLGLDTPLELQGLSQVDNNQKTEYFADGLIKITKPATDGLYYFAGKFGASNILTEDYLDQIRGQTVFATVKNPRSNVYGGTKKPSLYIYYWWNSTGVPTVVFKEFNSTDTSVSLSLDVPQTCTNILVAIRYQGTPDLGDWLAFNELGLQINNPIYEQNPSNIFGNHRGSFTAIKSNGDFALSDWVKSPAIFTQPPTYGYDLGDIWRWDETQVWDGMNMVCIANETPHYINDDGSIITDNGYRTTPFLNLGSKLYTMGNRTTPNAGYTVRICYYDSDFNFIVRAMSPHPATTAALDNAPRLQAIPANSAYVRFCIELEPSLYFGASTTGVWSNNPKDYLKGRQYGTFTPVAKNTKLDFNDLVEYAGGGSSEVTPIPLFAYNYQHYYNYAYGSSAPFFDRIKIHPAYTYDYIYEGRANGDDGVFMVDNDSMYIGSADGSPLEITIHGPAVNPYWYVVVGSEIVQSDGYNLMIAAGSKLVVSSVPGEQRAVIVSGGGIESNVYQSQRLDLTNFVTLPAGISQVVFYNCKDIDYKYRKESVVV